MSYIILQKPGSTKHAPCVEECRHIDCAATKDQAATLCPFCTQPLGFNRPLTRDEGNDFSHSLAHFSCIEDYINKGRVVAV